MLKNKQHRKQALLLLSVCSYLYHILDIPYYTHENAYLKYTYEMVAEWALSDDYSEGTETYLRECRQAAWTGETMERKIFNYNNITRFKQRLESFKSRCRLDAECLELAKEAFSLFEKYPDANIFRNVCGKQETEDDDDEVDIITIGMYVSFFADNAGLLYQSVIDSVNTGFQEHTEMQEPVITKRFDGTGIIENCLDFESRVFDLIDNLIYILNNF